MKTFLSILIFFHGAIHVLGFIKAFQFAKVDQLIIPISKPLGILWLLAFVLFLVSGIMYLLNSPQWSFVAILSVVISTILIIFSWSDARFGMVPNIIILIACIFAFASFNYKSVYLKDIKHAADKSSFVSSILTEIDILHLPIPVQNYIKLSGSIGKPKVYNFRVEFEGQIRKNEQSEWMTFTCEQHNFMANPTRLFFMDARMKGLPVAGYHHFKNGKAVMDIRLLSLIKVQYAEGNEMDISENVTFFNDMCCMAPATLIDNRIKWMETKGDSVKCSFTTNNNTINATLVFNEKAELVNFISSDRYAFGENGKMTRVPWQTPIKAYKSVNGYYLTSFAQLIYNYPEGDFTYGTFNLKSIQYNCKEIK